MSTDFNAVCHYCKKYQHIGQRFTGSICFGFGSKDEEGRIKAAEFLLEHMYCGLPNEREIDYNNLENLPRNLVIVDTDYIPNGYERSEDGNIKGLYDSNSI